MSETLDPKETAPAYWTTLSEYDQDAEYMRRVGEEFYPDAKPNNFFDVAGDEEKLLSPMQRRTFLKLSGFAALAGALSSCERPVQEILPYVNKPMDVTPGIANFYASSLDGPEGLGILIKSREGRPVKLEGNPDSPLTEGGTSTQAQVEILKLYDPDRLKYPVEVKRQGNVDPTDKKRLSDFDAQIGERLSAAYGEVVLLTPTIHGPANKRVINDFRKACRKFRHVTFDALQDGYELKANEECFGKRVVAQQHFDKANTIVFLGGDPLAQGSAPTASHLQIGKKHHPDADGGMARIYAFEPVPTISGIKADYRYQVAPADLLTIGLALAHEIIIEHGSELQYAKASQFNGLRTMLGRYSIDSVAGTVGVSADNLRRVAKSLLDEQGRSIINIEGAATRTEDGYALQLVSNLLNYALGSYGHTMDIESAPANYVGGGYDDILQLLDDMKSGQVDVLITWGVNPAYTLPANAEVAQAFESVDFIVSLGMKMDETMAMVDVAVPGVHSLESWGDSEPVAGLYHIQQPAIRPLFSEESADSLHETRAWQESLMAFSRAADNKEFYRSLTEEELSALATAEGVEVSELSEEQTAPKPVVFHDYIKSVWEEEVYPSSGSNKDFYNFWIDTLQLGLVDLRKPLKRGRMSIETAALEAMKPAGSSNGLTLVALPTAHHGDGESMGIPHLLEMPDPITKVSWDNYVMMPPSRADELGVGDGDHVAVTVDGVTVEGPARIQPGIHKDVIAIYLGWGRDTNDGIGHMLGINGYKLVRRSGNQVVTSGLPAEIVKGSGRTRLADSQGHNYLYSPTYAGIMTNKRKGEVQEGASTNENGKPVYARPIVGETTLKEWKKDPYHGFPNHHMKQEEIPSMWEAKHKYVGHHWGLTVDLNACTGCGACMVACSIENNVPVVGKEELAMGREMFWIRIDRYYRGEKDDPDFVNMPLMCQHCDNAPCETVCPVIATLHNDEGMNVMVYNRCVGTRYCANNCPYKVRRFNFWQYSDWRTGPKEKIKNVSPLELVLNPDVTTRSRGVMEKCTFCIQRTRVAKDEARMAGRRLEDGDVQSACQQACPAKAIQFGDRNNPNSKVAKLWEDPRSYGLLADLNTDPSVQYLTLVRNRDESVPYRTKYMAHRVDHKGHDKHGEDAHESTNHASDGDH